MIRLELNDPLHIRIDHDAEWTYLKALKEHLSAHVEGFRFMPAYQTGQWDGRISLFNTRTRTFPYGLLTDVFRFTRDYPAGIEIEISDEVKNLFKGVSFAPTFDLALSPYDYQEDCIRACLARSKGIIRAGTAAGKSLMIAYVIKNLFDNNEIQQALIIVPSLGLIEQFYENLIEYGIDEELLGKVNSKKKDFKKPIVISTWQSLKNRKSELCRYGCIIVDEVHGAKANVLKDILSETTNAYYRFGFTGTMPNGLLDEWNVRSYLGPVLRDYGAKQLADKGYVSKCLIKQVAIYYDDEYSGQYSDIREDVFTNPYRIGFVTHIVSQCKESVLILVEKVEKEGEYLEAFLKEHHELKDREIVFLSGRDDAETREVWRKYTDKKNNIVVIATYGIFQLGINIKSLQNLILAAPSKSKIRVLQSIGRTLRKSLHKGTSTIWDICDMVKFLDDHGDKRMRHYSMEGFEVEEYVLYEDEDITYELRSEINVDSS